jgi:hypothetical protein
LGYINVKFLVLYSSIKEKIGLKLQGKIIIPVQNAIWVSENPIFLYNRETTVPPNTKLGKPMANQVVGIQVMGFFF